MPKVIGTTQTGFLVECSPDEFAKMGGYYTYSNLTKAKGDIKVGASLEITHVYERYLKFKEAAEKIKSLKAASDELHTLIADFLVPIDQLFSETLSDACIDVDAIKQALNMAQDEVKTRKIIRS